jgi:hypothetical protein
MGAYFAALESGRFAQFFTAARPARLLALASSFGSIGTSAPAGWVNSARNVLISMAQRS